MKKFTTGLFFGVEAGAYQQMLTCFDAKEKTYQPGNIICDFSDTKDILGILKSGSAETVSVDEFGNRTILETLTAGNVFGWPLSAVYRDDSLMVVCEKPCSVLFIHYQHIIKRCEKACEHHSRLVENLLRMMSEKNAYLGFRVKVLSGRSIREKLLCYFRFMAAENDGNAFQLPFSMSSLADYICCDRSAMMRELKKMREEGLIRVDRRRITFSSSLPSPYTS